ncbi:thermonuclease family protein [Aurantimonas sp. E1-2-R+4]|uniref:thermonuclease family protein n=1 Tax=Aurantimonas sp. E1-2-R+4 TaxID=3113714 RepID=UPI002F9588BF
MLLAGACIVAFAAPFAARQLPELVTSSPAVPTAPAVTTAAPPARPLPVCSGGNRAARKLTCIVDGDTGWERGVKWRALDVDTPEIGKPECAAERRLGEKARDRLRQLMGSGYTIEWTGGKGKFGRELARVRLTDGRDAGQVLIQEGLSQPWPNEGNKWCRN